MIRKYRVAFSKLPIKWKIALWSSLIIFFLFAAYNFVQYLVLKNWAVQHETMLVRKSMGQLQNYYGEKDGALDEKRIAAGKAFVEEMIDNDQLIRILNARSEPLFTVYKDVSPEWVAPKAVDTTELFSVNRLEDRLLVMRSPIAVSNFRGTIEIVTNMETFDQFNDRVLIVMLIGIFAAVLLSALAGMAIARKLLQPVQSLSQAIVNVKKKGLNERVQAAGNGDELSQLAELFNDLMNQLETSFLKQKRFIEDASHELRTPVTILEGHLSLLNRWGKSDPHILDGSLQASLQEVRRLRGIVQELLMLTRAESSRPPTEALEPVKLGQKVNQIAGSFAALYPDYQFSIDVEKLEDTKIMMVLLHLEQVLLIVLDNAVKYGGDAKKTEIKGWVQAQTAFIEIKDYGIGIAERHLPYVFDRFYRADQARSGESGGSGLGLSIAKRLVENASGQLSIASHESMGTTVTIQLSI